MKINRKEGLKITLDNILNIKQLMALGDQKVPYGVSLRRSAPITLHRDGYLRAEVPRRWVLHRELQHQLPRQRTLLQGRGLGDTGTFRQVGTFAENSKTGL